MLFARAMDNDHENTAMNAVSGPVRFPARNLLFSLLLAAAALLLPGPGEAQAPDAADIAANNRGVGLMGHFDYAAATEVFAELVARHPTWHDLRLNLAVATLNRQFDGDEAQALALVRHVLSRDPDHLRAHYIHGLLSLYGAEPEEAAAHFRRVVDADPGDAYAAYYLAQARFQLGDHEAAHVLYERAQALDPYLMSAYYGDLQALQRLGRRDEARERMQTFRRLRDNPRARTVAFKYTRMGPKGEVLALGVEQAEAAAPPPDGALFSHPIAIGGVPGARGLTQVDVNADGHMDLFAAGEDGGRLFLGNGGGRFEPVEFPPGKDRAIRAALWGDVDNDGLIDLYLCRQGPNRLWRQSPAGTWQDVTVSSATSGGQVDTVAGRLFDADHDGDLDLFLVNADAPNALLNNNLDGTFRPIATAQGIAGDARASRGLLVADLDADRDLDLLVINVEPPHQAFLNDRLWAYRPAPGLEDFLSQPLAAAVAGDLDTDGRVELYGLAPDGSLLRWRRDAADAWSRDQVAASSGDASESGLLGLLDARGDGVPQLLVADASGWRLVDAADGRVVFQTPGAEQAPPADLSPVLVVPEQGPGLAVLDGAGGVTLHAPGPGRYAYLALSLSGREDQAQSMRSNASGLGARISVRIGSRWSLADRLPSLSSPGQGLAPVSIGLGGASKAAFVAIDWSDGVYQSELDLAPGPVHRIEETQRQLSSCPVLFAWDGERYAFVTDLLGVGGIGYAVAPGEYAEPRPWENLLLPAGLLQPKNGRLVLKLTEPMEEAAYIDSLALDAWDLPPGWDLVTDDRMGIMGPAPTGEPLFFRHQIAVARAVDGRGEDVAARLARADLDAAPVGALDHRFIGRLAAEHLLTLELAEPIDPARGRPLLVADGWVEYPYSQTMFAAWQASADFRAPTLEARGSDGIWQVVAEQFGYPAGMPRRMALPLPPLPAGTQALRLRGNMEVYWDRLSVVYAEDLPQAKRRTLPLRDASVAVIGFPRWSRGAQQLPSYDYDHRGPFWDTRYQEGLYTRPGPVEALVRESDDALAIIGAGEEIQLSFEASEPAPDGWTRRYVLRARGWAKDMDLYTKDGDTLEPLPAAGHDAAKRERLHARYNTRFQAGR